MFAICRFDWYREAVNGTERNQTTMDRSHPPPPPPPPPPLSPPRKMNRATCNASTAASRTVTTNVMASTAIPMASEEDEAIVCSLASAAMSSTIARVAG
ncbi:hypothetical protein P389DRAFT_97554 [Cystobasidium minutum MCA 4210]|uniref:uncharacterized protein n=1 Tax=Cystobasidium minutum MCA 4210 TaxID=1397322 RepID=UPI0034CF59D0|eukprot:jgi/Rhomi1/97554/CE97553_39